MGEPVCAHEVEETVGSSKTRKRINVKRANFAIWSSSVKKWVFGAAVPTDPATDYQVTRNPANERRSMNFFGSSHSDEPGKWAISPSCRTLCCLRRAQRTAFQRPLLHDREEHRHQYQNMNRRRDHATDDGSCDWLHDIGPDSALPQDRRQTEHDDRDCHQFWSKALNRS